MAKQHLIIWSLDTLWQQSRYEQLQAAVKISVRRLKMPLTASYLGWLDPYWN